MEKLIKKSLFDHKVRALSHNPYFLNNFYENQILNDINHQLKKCQEVYIAVSFLTASGVNQIISAIENNPNLKKGQLVFTDENFITDIKAFDQLKAICDNYNFEVRIYQKELNDYKGFHSKKYIFKNEKKATIINTSANLTYTALTNKQESGLAINCFITGELYKESYQYFKNIWQSSTKLKNYNVEKYANDLQKIKELEKLTAEVNQDDAILKPLKKQINPNQFQKEAIQNLEKCITKQKNKGLLIAATGVGKTMITALFLYKNRQKYNKVLFLVHSRIIMQNAIRDYEKVGFLKENLKEIKTANIEEIKNSGIYFITDKTMNKHKNKFNEKEFDFIIIDEAHHSSAKQHEAVIKYFKPRFLLGMTATPERTDGVDIFALYNHEIIHEIRLFEALECEYLSPFNYFSHYDQHLSDKIKINKQNAKIIVEKIKYDLVKYPPSGHKIKGLIFVPEISEAKLISQALNEVYQKDIAVCINEVVSVEQIFLKLENDLNRLSFIVAVNKLNEGIDIPDVNLVIFLRNTQSKIVFLQQLGRGLRKRINKELIVLDYIGNYANNYTALAAFSKSGVTNKSEIYQIMYDMSPSRFAQINLTQIEKAKIAENLEKTISTRTKEISLYKKDIFKIADKLNRIPTINELVKLTSLNTVEYGLNLIGNYYKFWQGHSLITKNELNKMEINFLNNLNELAVNYPHVRVKVNKYLKSNSICHNNRTLIYYFFNQHDEKASEYAKKSIKLSKTLTSYINDYFIYNEKYVPQKTTLKLYNRYTRSEQFIINGINPHSNHMGGQKFVNDEFYLLFNIVKNAKGYDNELINKYEVKYFTNKQINETTKLLSNKYPIKVFINYDSQKDSRLFYMGEAQIIKPINYSDQKVKLGKQECIITLKNEIPEWLMAILKPSKI